MDFSLSPEQEAFKKEIRRFVDENLTPELRAEVECEQYSIGPLGKQFLKLMGRQGWLGVGWPREYGGQGRGAIEQWLFLEEMAAENLPTGALTLSSAERHRFKFLSASFSCQTIQDSLLFLAPMTLLEYLKNRAELREFALASD